MTNATGYLPAEDYVRAASALGHRVTLGHRAHVDGILAGRDVFCTVDNYSAMVFVDERNLRQAELGILELESLRLVRGILDVLDLWDTVAAKAEAKTR